MGFSGNPLAAVFVVSSFVRPLLASHADKPLNPGRWRIRGDFLPAVGASAVIVVHGSFRWFWLLFNTGRGGCQLTISTSLPSR